MKELITIITLLFLLLTYLSYEVEETTTIKDYNWEKENDVWKIKEGEYYQVDSQYVLIRKGIG